MSVGAYLRIVGLPAWAIRAPRGVHETVNVGYPCLIASFVLGRFCAIVRVLQQRTSEYAAPVVADEAALPSSPGPPTIQA